MGLLKILSTLMLLSLISCNELSLNGSDESTASYADAGEERIVVIDHAALEDEELLENMEIQTIDAMALSSSKKGKRLAAGLLSARCARIAMHLEKMKARFDEAVANDELNEEQIERIGKFFEKVDANIDKCEQRAAEACEKFPKKISKLKDKADNLQNGIRKDHLLELIKKLEDEYVANCP